MLTQGAAATALQRLREAQARDGHLPLARRREALRALRRLVTTEAETFAAAISQDFGQRSWHETMISEIGVVVACRVVLKPSEHVPRTAAALCAAVARHLDPDLVAAVEGGPEVAAEMSGLAFDKLLFTGSTDTGRRVLRAAADTLTPVVLELGGKSPAILDPSADLKQAASDIVAGKLLNAGQTCVAPDYVLLPRAAVPVM